MDRRQPFARRVRLHVFQQLSCGRAHVEIAPHEEAWPVRRCEGHRDRQLRVITASNPCVGLGPGEVENEFPIRVGFRERRDRPGQPVSVGQSEITRIPTRPGADAMGVLERGEEFMTQERIAVAPERIPLSRVELVDALVET